MSIPPEDRAAIRQALRVAGIAVPADSRAVNVAAVEAYRLGQLAGQLGERSRWLSGLRIPSRWQRANTDATYVLGYIPLSFLEGE